MDKLTKRLAMTKEDNSNYKKQKELNDKEIKEKLQSLIKKKEEAER